MLLVATNGATTGLVSSLVNADRRPLDREIGLGINVTGIVSHRQTKREVATELAAIGRTMAAAESDFVKAKDATATTANGVTAIAIRGVRVPGIATRSDRSPETALESGLESVTGPETHEIEVRIVSIEESDLESMTGPETQETEVQRVNTE